MFFDRTHRALIWDHISKSSRTVENRRLRPQDVVRRCTLIIALTAGGGCALTPSGTKEEKALIEQAGKPYEQKFEARELPELPLAPSWANVLERAFLANGDLEASYFDWKASFQRIEIASAYPNSNVEVGYSYMFSSERMKSFDRQAFGLGFDSAVNLSFPTKVAQQGKVALDQARASGERFRTAKFELQRRVLSAWADYMLLAERLRINKEQLGLLRLSADAVRARAQLGGAQRDFLKVEALVRTGEDAVKGIEAQLTASRAMLNGMLARSPNASLDVLGAHEELRPMHVPDDALIAAAVERSPELSGLARQVEGRSDALELARMQWIPDISPTAIFAGGVSQAIGAAIMLPTNVVGIQGGIREAEAMLQGGEAMLRQARRDKASSVVATLVALRNSERQAKLFEASIVPLADRVLANSQQAYATGAAQYLDLLDAQRTVLDARLVAAEARASREKRLAELEAMLGTDIEMLNSGRALAAEAGRAGHVD